MQQKKITFLCSLCFWIFCMFQSCAITKPVIPTRPYYRSPVIHGSIATFKVWAQDAQEIYLVGSFNNWKRSPRYKLTKGTNDIWQISTRLGPGSYEYVFLIDGRKKIDLINNEFVSDGRGGKSSVVIVQ